MELRCPKCASPEVEPYPEGGSKEHYCERCGVRFARGSALVTVNEAESYRGGESQPLFAFNPTLAAAKLREAAIGAVNPYSDADELNALLEAAQATPIIEAEHEQARIYIYPLSIGEPDALLAVDPGGGPTLLGYSLKLRQREREDPVSFTVRFLEEAVEEANELAAGPATDSARLDRIAAFMKDHRPCSRGDVCEVLAIELGESGRSLNDG